MNKHESEYQAGAVACVAAMASVDQSLRGYRDETATEYFANYDAGVAAIVAVAGDLSPTAAGAMAALAELVVAYALGDAAIGCLGDWTPRAAKTPGQRDAERNDLETVMLTAMALDQARRSNVVPLRPVK